MQAARNSIGFIDGVGEVSPFIRKHWLDCGEDLCALGRLQMDAGNAFVLEPQE